MRFKIIRLVVVVINNHRSEDLHFPVYRGLKVLTTQEVILILIKIYTILIQSYSYSVLIVILHREFQF